MGLSKELYDKVLRAKRLSNIGTTKTGGWSEAAQAFLNWFPGVLAINNFWVNKASGFIKVSLAKC